MHAQRNLANNQAPARPLHSRQARAWHMPSMPSACACAWHSVNAHLSCVGRQPLSDMDFRWVPPWAGQWMSFVECHLFAVCPLTCLPSVTCLPVATLGKRKLYRVPQVCQVSPGWHLANEVFAECSTKSAQQIFGHSAYKWFPVVHEQCVFSTKFVFHNFLYSNTYTKGMFEWSKTNV